MTLTPAITEADIGREFRTRDARIGKVIRKCTEALKCWVVSVENGPHEHYWADGRYAGGTAPVNDLIARIPKEQVMSQEVKPKYETPKATIYASKTEMHYRIKCGGQELRARGADNLAIHASLLMQECDRLRWIIREVDRRGGGTLAFDVSEETQADYEVIEIE